VSIKIKCQMDMVRRKEFFQLVYETRSKQSLAFVNSKNRFILVMDALNCLKAGCFVRKKKLEFRNNIHEPIKARYVVTFFSQTLNCLIKYSLIGREVWAFVVDVSDYTHL
jgi:hypothetical protein